MIDPTNQEQVTEWVKAELEVSGPIYPTRFVNALTLSGVSGKMIRQGLWKLTEYGHIELTDVRQIKLRTLKKV